MGLQGYDRCYNLETQSRRKVVKRRAGGGICVGHFAVAAPLVVQHLGLGELQS